MILSIFTDLWDKMKELSDKFYDFIMRNYSEPFFWIIIFGILLLVAYYAISNLANK